MLLISLGLEGGSWIILANEQRVNMLNLVGSLAGEERTYVFDILWLELVI